MNDSKNDIILWMEEWYQKYCDGDWEHDEHFSISNIDNPGWRISVNLVGTDCENKKFEKIKVEKTDTDWYHCFLRDGKFEAAGGPRNLLDMLTTFKNWAES